jgi:very-short-patch-repair endonuclease
LRRNATDVERKLWAVLRNRQLDGLKFRRQATIGPFIVDFLCVEARLIVELDGGQHSEARDAARTSWLGTQDYRIVRFWNHEVIENFDGVVEAIRLALIPEERPSPNPLPREAGEGHYG